uniref:Uncharacterized protein n=1 Tax=Oryza sativa subsp. japonica TaxID=39947 RepID=Q69LI4_ORYSJ|nr:hypothetical protein [Oryza sativa Japonica Group]BAD36446.1 hypothetical protein [Oryza sativa Japonica Group]
MVLDQCSSDRSSHHLYEWARYNYPLGPRPAYWRSSDHIYNRARVLEPWPGTLSTIGLVRCHGLRGRER